MTNLRTYADLFRIFFEFADVTVHLKEYFDILGNVLICSLRVRYLTATASQLANLKHKHCKNGGKS